MNSRYIFPFVLAPALIILAVALYMVAFKVLHMFGILHGSCEYGVSGAISMYCDWATCQADGFMFDDVASLVDRLTIFIAGVVIGVRGARL